MKFDFKNLDQETRKLMLDEVNRDIANKQLYLSKRFNEAGEKLYPQILSKALTFGDEQSFATDLRGNNCFKTHEERKTKTGVTQVKVPDTAHTTLAESEFNRFYIRALCLRAMEANQRLTVYRARQSDNPRPESEMMIGTNVDPNKLLIDLRTSMGTDTALGLPPGPNSGLTVRL